MLVFIVRFFMWLTVASLAACGGSAIRLEGRPCTSNLDCLDSYVCVTNVCVTGGAPPVPDGVPGASLVIDAGELQASNVPVRVTIDVAYLNLDLVNATGSNMRFVDRDSQQPLSFELERFDATNGATAWLQLPELSGAARVQIVYGPKELAAFDDTGWLASEFS